MDYRPDPISGPMDLIVLANAGPEPSVDSVLRDFLFQSYLEVKERCARGGLLQLSSLGQRVPWLYRLSFDTHGLACGENNQILPVKRHSMALRFPTDYLRNANRFEMLRLIEPTRPFHPNICPSTGAICLEIYPGESLLEIVESLHDLLRWRLRQYDERDALNKAACAWGRDHVHQPIDDRPLFGRRLQIKLEPVGQQP